MDRLSFAGLRGKGLKHSVLGVVRLFKALAQSANVFGARRADAVLGMGGYVCFPGGLMAWVMRRPLMLVNADAALLLSNKALAPVAGKIAFGFDGLAAAQQRKAVVTGNPVRAEIEDLPAPELRFADRTGPLKVAGGGRLAGRARDQRGAPANAGAAAYAKAGVQAEVVPFIHDMAARLAEADVVICRAGAVTVSELCAAGAASILVPLVVSTTSHQRDNAQLHGAARRRDPPAAGRAQRREAACVVAATARGLADAGVQGPLAGASARRVARGRRARSPGRPQGREGSARMRHAVQRIHFTGIGGAGMSGIAELLAGQGYRVSGSDQGESETTRRLRALGVDVKIAMPPNTSAMRSCWSSPARSRPTTPS
ncbi:mur ligase family, catalytic domain-containing protein [Ditylenchus destructor]|nr:mur ligase family, catalytic domain-containing protein [Ditylenchus destructor]